MTYCLLLFFLFHFYSFANFKYYQNWGRREREKIIVSNYPPKQSKTQTKKKYRATKIKEKRFSFIFQNSEEWKSNSSFLLFSLASKSFGLKYVIINFSKN